MKYQVVTVGDLETNCYILNIKEDFLIIDPGDQIEKIQSYLNGKVIAICITHHHYDHVGALTKLQTLTQAPIYSFDNLEEKSYQFGKFHVEVIYTPGHTKDSISFYFPQEQLLFVGDFMFAGTIGRTDLEGGSLKEMVQSIDKMQNYPKNTSVLPGHGAKTTLGREYQNNPYFKIEY